jgi:thioredoxin-like negative regulator of GroEL
MLERLAFLIAFAVLVALAVLLVRSWNARRVRRVLHGPSTAVWDSLGEAPDGRRTLVTFSTPSCAACHAAQAPAVTAVEERLGAAQVRVIRVDAAQRPEVARAFGVLTVPSTVVLAPAGEVVAVNQGFAPSGHLVEQLQRA